ncbi:hypothetical protein ACE3IK_07255 [Enterobacter hormaechei subsp. xiangfangensis]|uniref:hypothetical protein n=1 Tax=Enterobacteriaceae TaxID=543 RepID=UPI0009082925|nr:MULTISPECIES: hypothetical protein [Enterobacteriaceae]MCC9357005.1 hypothetical protein [Enterobacter hormaechei subsp. xiangfangensis]MCK1004403.1 hypothetical protein [Enterobacter hormaechei subsp. xiangfangensis]MCO1571074.1 hypothetical protein [Enterobacter hormaechei]MCO5979656.1 hypothetical protein [Enterobacter hormaechei]MCU2365127.1 hypothetical protein [Enterobacter hormaechei subsp. xiangfangensis]
MLDRTVLEKAIIVAAELQGHELNGRDRLMVRNRVATCLAAKERHRQRMDAEPYQWRKPERPR